MAVGAHPLTKPRMPSSLYMSTFENKQMLERRHSRHGDSEAIDKILVFLLIYLKTTFDYILYETIFIIFQEEKEVTNNRNHCRMRDTTAEHTTQSTIDKVFGRTIFTAVLNYKSFRNSKTQILNTNELFLIAGRSADELFVLSLSTSDTARILIM
jgi:hypothetical protein